MTQTLWESLGGETIMWKVVDEFVNRALQDPKVNYHRSGKYFHDEMKIAQTKKRTFDFLSGALGGPYQYRGPSLREIHGKMEITESEFDAFAKHFKTALEKYGISKILVQTVIDMVEKVKPVIVTPSSKGKRKSGAHA